MSRRLHVIEQRLDVADRVIRDLDQKLARVDGRTSILNRERAASGQAMQAGEGQGSSDN
ncbi:hypothetical protein [Methylobacterium nigriterrae]|uniref:hypothetical protein n=1 Tax=Methylobacterium nigriterrae TaxID=3127512 RepID=UPI003013A62E